jgi:hypothetical protein
VKISDATIPEPTEKNRFPVKKITGAVSVLKRNGINRTEKAEMPKTLIQKFRSKKNRGGLFSFFSISKREGIPAWE